MPTISMDDSPYSGRTAAVPWRRPHEELSCRRCGTRLAGHREAVEQVTTRGVCFVREVFRCRCGRNRWVERQERAA